MSFSVGIIGLPNAGKSTLFKALTKQQVDIASYPFTTIQPNIGIVAVPDERLKKIAEIIKPEKITPTIIKFIDIAGLVKGAHRGEGLGNQFLSHIRNCDAVIEVIRVFENPNVEHVNGTIDPREDTETIKTELLMKDLETLEKLLQKLEKEAKTEEKVIFKKIELLKKIKELVSQGKLILEINLTDEEKIEIKEYQFLTAKPIIYLFNIKEQLTENKKQELKKNFSARYSLFIDVKLEEEAFNLSDSEKEELELKSQLDQLIITCYNILELISFFTIAKEKETRAWTLINGSNIFEAAGKVHSDFQEKFIRAEVISWQELIKTGTWKIAKETGQIKTAGKDYIVQDGDVLEFKI